MAGWAKGGKWEFHFYVDFIYLIYLIGWNWRRAEEVKS
jgi:hypothetical protein